MRKRCERCRWWEREEDGPTGPDHRSLPGAWGQCVLMRRESDDAVNGNTRAVAWDWEGCRAGVSTRSDFGCVMFEPAGERP